MYTVCALRALFKKGQSFSVYRFGTYLCFTEPKHCACILVQYIAHIVSFMQYELKPVRIVRGDLKSKMAAMAWVGHHPLAQRRVIFWGISKIVYF
jgi:hypothetical protein